MAIALVDSTAGAGLNTFTTSPANTTGATLICIGVTAAAGFTSAPTDSKGNTWTQLTRQGTNSTSVLFKCHSPIVGSGHTFTLTGTGIAAVMCVQAFSGAGDLDLQSGSSAGPSGSGSNPGTITASSAGELFVTMYDVERVGTISIVGGPTTPNVTANIPLSMGVNYGGAMAWFTSAGSENPLWTCSNAPSRESAVMATFAASSASTQPIMLVIT